MVGVSLEVVRDNFQATTTIRVNGSGLVAYMSAIMLPLERFSFKEGFLKGNVLMTHVVAWSMLCKVIGDHATKPIAEAILT